MNKPTLHSMFFTFIIYSLLAAFIIAATIHLSLMIPLDKIPLD